jgi:hypothetical protein
MGPHYAHCLPIKLDEMFIVPSFQLTPLNFLHSPSCEKKFADMAFIYWLKAWPFCCPIKLKGHSLPKKLDGLSGNLNYVPYLFVTFLTSLDVAGHLPN